MFPLTSCVHFLKTSRSCCWYVTSFTYFLTISSYRKVSFWIFKFNKIVGQANKETIYLACDLRKIERTYAYSIGKEPSRCYSHHRGIEPSEIFSASNIFSKTWTYRCKNKINKWRQDSHAPWGFRSVKYFEIVRPFEFQPQFPKNFNIPF